MKLTKIAFLISTIIGTQGIAFADCGFQAASVAAQNEVNHFASASNTGFTDLKLATTIDNNKHQTNVLISFTSLDSSQNPASTSMLGTLTLNASCGVIDNLIIPVTDSL